MADMAAMDPSLSLTVLALPDLVSPFGICRDASAPADLEGGGPLEVARLKPGFGCEASLFN